MIPPRVEKFVDVDNDTFPEEARKYAGAGLVFEVYSFNMGEKFKGSLDGAS